MQIPGLAARFVIVAFMTPAIVLLGTEAYAQRGNAALQAGSLAEARASFATAARLSPWRDDLWERAASAALAVGDAQGALHDLEHVRGSSIDSYLILGGAHLKLGAADSALWQYQEALQRLGPDPRLYAGLAAAYRQQGNAQLEQHSLESQIRMDPNAATAYYRLGLLKFVASPSAAMAHLSHAAQIDPAFEPAVQTLEAAASLASTQGDGAASLVALGRGLGLVEEWKLAADAFDDGTRADPGEGEAWAWLGEARQHLGMDARSELDRAVLLSAESATVHGLRGLYFQRAGDNPQALREFGLASGLEPDNPMWHASIAETHTLSGDLTAALAAYQRATEVAPKEPDTWRLLAAFCASNAVFVEEIGIPAALTASELAPGDPAVQDVLGWTYLLTGRYVLAEAALEGALRTDPAYTQARLHLALTYSAQGRVAEARDHLVYLVRTDPGSDAAQQAGLLLEESSDTP